MQLTVYISIPLAANLAEFSQYLRQKSIPHRIVEQDGKQQLWAVDETALAEIANLYENFKQEGTLSEPEKAKVNYAAAGLGYFLLLPVTLGVIVVATIIALYSWYVAEDLLRLLLFQDVVTVDENFIFLDQDLPWQEGGYWRLFTPALLHFSWVHLVFNCLWMWEFGRRIEIHQGKWRLVGLLLTIALLSNLAQYFAAGSSLFGGLSGVIYGLAGYCWLWSKLRPEEPFAVPDSLFYALVIIMVVMMTGVFGALGIAQIANNAHFAGLVAGLALALVLSAATSRNKLSANKEKEE